MKRLLGALAALLCFSFPAHAEHIRSRVLLVSDDATVPQTLAHKHGGQATRISGSNVYVIDLPAGYDEAAMRGRFKLEPHVQAAELDELVPPAFDPNDTYYTSEWHLQTVEAPAAWDVATGSGVVVAVLDSGVDATHPDLAGQLVPGWNFYDNNSNTADVYGHGTKVAGVVAAVGNNAMGVVGVAFSAQIMPIRVTDTNGYASISALANGLTYAADHGARVANMSFAVQSYSTIISAAQYLAGKGGVAVNSAGNGGTLDSTAASSALVSVSATDSTDTLASWSSYGPYVDVSAPGVSIWTTTMGGGYGAVSGTSFSSPLTAGVVALMMSVNPALPPDQIVGLLETSATDLGATGYDQYYGYGRVDAYHAVVAARDAVATQPPPPPPPPPPVSDTTPPVVSISLSTAGKNTKISVTATDNVGVTSITLSIDGAVVASSNSSPLSYTWKKPSGTHTLSATARDAAGNTTTVTQAATR